MTVTSALSRGTKAMSSVGSVASTAAASSNTASSSLLAMGDNQKQALLYCSLLALQFGLQPMIAAKFTPPGVSKSSVVITTEVFKILIAVLSLLASSSTEWEKIREQWTLWNSLQIAALPATLYAIQNLLVQYGYVLLDSMTFNLLNQTKTLSAALWLWILLGQPQSPVQMVALMMLLGAAVMLNIGGSSSSASSTLVDHSGYSLGLMMVAIASMLSGLSSALTQKALVGKQSRSPVFLSAELAVYGILFLLGNLYFNNDIKGDNLFSNWQWYTLIPVTTNAFGGIVVGQVTKYAGGVVKGFALIAGIIITGVAQWLIDGKPLGVKDGLAVILVSASIYLHAKFPVVKTSKPSSEESDDKKKR